MASLHLMGSVRQLQLRLPFKTVRTAVDKYELQLAQERTTTVRAVRGESVVHKKNDSEKDGDEIITLLYRGTGHASYTHNNFKTLHYIVITIKLVLFTLKLVTISRVLLN